MGDYLASQPCENNRCFACESGYCTVLNDTKFEKNCPFFKTRERIKAEAERAKEITQLMERHGRKVSK